MPRVGFELTIAAGERQKTYALDRVATGTGILIVLFMLIHQSYSRLLLQKTLVAYLSDRMFPLSHRPIEPAVHVTI